MFGMNVGGIPFNRIRPVFGCGGGIVVAVTAAAFLFFRGRL